MSELDDKIEKAKEAISEVFSDMSVSQVECKENMEDLISHAEDMLNSLGE